ncbi:hypothetical protein F4778DRAFT_718444 [Xylariomycetidae sp. FL2044]|nr:hypothetical protein F4778DRAFT_718444 [Xylariomycetidae sp. FL2044]
MSSTEDQELMARIGKLAGQINRHKAQRDGSTSVPDAYAPRGAYQRPAPYSRGAYRGGRVRSIPTYRHKSLVLNGQPRTPTSPQESSDEQINAAGSSWVAKNDRHLQLINSSVYEKESQQRASAIEQTARRKQYHQNHREKLKLMNTFRQGNGSFSSFSTHDPSTPRHEIEIDGVRFQVVQQGSKLIKAPGDVNPPSATPKQTSIGGVKFHRTKNGNLVRHGIVKAQRLAGGVKKVNEQCKAFSWTGSCPKGPACRYIHDASKTAVCRDWLLKGNCPRGDACDLAHETTVERTPLCLHFAKGNCNNPSCSYVHVEHSPTDPVCREFGIYGYCDKGAGCPHRHVLECPDFSNTGVCKLKGCKRLHIERASVLRRTGIRESSEEAEDLSSDEDEAAADSDDVDSDEVEEFIGHDDIDDDDFAEQKDFIGFK